MKLFRIQSWWNTVVPQVLGWIYFSILYRIIDSIQNPVEFYFVNSFQVIYSPTRLFFLSLVSIAAFGYLFNDLCDIDSDVLSGKPNALARFNLFWRVVIVYIPFLMGIVCWFEMNRDFYFYSERAAYANLPFALQLIALVVYSARPFRLKERAELGVICDAFYGHLNPVLITLGVFGLAKGIGIWTYLFVFLLALVCFIKGIRNILLHQIEDRKKDSSSRINTVVIKYGPWRVINFINNFLFPAEIFFLVCLTIVMCIHIPPMFIPLMLFAIISYLKLSGWKVGYADRRLLEFKFTYFMNDYYEGWFPVFTLIILSVYRHEFVFLLILHLLLFPRFTLNLVKDLKKINENFKTEEDY